MKVILIIIVWIGVLIIDGIVMPALLGIPIGYGSTIFLIAIAMTYGVHRWVIYLGLVIACLTELVYGFYFGSLMIQWLVIMWIWYSLNNFFSLKVVNKNDYWFLIVPYIFYGLLLFGLAQISAWSLVRFSYDYNLLFSITRDILTNPYTFIIMIVELIVMFIILKSCQKNIE